MFAQARKSAAMKISRTLFKYTAIAALTLSLSYLPAQAEGTPDTASEGFRALSSIQDHIMRLSDQVKATVVHVEVIAKEGNQRRKNTGSGLILTKDGKIVTNYHVIDKAQVITVILDDKSKYEAEIIRDDQQTDLAFLKIKPNHDLPVAKLANSDDVKVGEWVIAVGNPYGFDRTVSFGIISGKSRFVPGADNGVPLINDFIQTDALIDHGNSGGPLVNMKGEVVGINSIGVGRGQGFTIPANIVADVDNRLEVKGKIQRGWLGVFMQPFTEEHAIFMGKPELRGMLIGDTTPGSPAQKAGLKSGDIITKFNGKAINANSDEATSRIKLEVAQLLPNQSVPVEFYRDGKYHNVVITLGTQPAVISENIYTDYGFVANEVTISLQLENRLPDRTGMLVSKVEKGSAAHNAGMGRGDVIKKINSYSINSAADLKTALEKVKNDQRFLITAKRGQITVYFLIDTASYSEEDPSKSSKDKEE